MREALMVKTLVLGCILVLRLSGSSPSLAFVKKESFPLEMALFVM